jgi:hypothetical protein
MSHASSPDCSILLKASGRVSTWSLFSPPGGEALGGKCLDGEGDEGLAALPPPLFLLQG